MFRTTILGAVAFCCALSFAGAAQAADCVPGSVAAKLLAFDPQHDKAAHDGLFVSLAIGLDPATFPQKDIAANPRHCARGGFDAGAAHFALFGDDAVLPYRWAESPAAPQTILYLALVPRPAAALEWLRKSRQGDNTAQFGDADMMYALAATDGSKRTIYAYFDVEPDDATLAVAMCGALTGQLPALGSYDTASQDSTFTGAATPPLASLHGCMLTGGK